MKIVSYLKQGWKSSIIYKEIYVIGLLTFLIANKMDHLVFNQN